MDYEFKSLKELYVRITPALRAKRTEYKTLGYPNISERDIWDYLTSAKWSRSSNLDLSKMVSDIFNLSISDINNYLINRV